MCLFGLLSSAQRLSSRVTNRIMLISQKSLLGLDIPSLAVLEASLLFSCKAEQQRATPPSPECHWKSPPSIRSLLSARLQTGHSLERRMGQNIFSLLFCRHGQSPYKRCKHSKQPWRAFEDSEFANAICCQTKDPIWRNSIRPSILFVGFWDWKNATQHIVKAN